MGDAHLLNENLTLILSGCCKEIYLRDFKDRDFFDKNRYDAGGGKTLAHTIDRSTTPNILAKFGLMRLKNCILLVDTNTDWCPSYGEKMRKKKLKKQRSPIPIRSGVVTRGMMALGFANRLWCLLSTSTLSHAQPIFPLQVPSSGVSWDDWPIFCGWCLWKKSLCHSSVTQSCCVELDCDNLKVERSWC